MTALATKRQPTARGATRFLRSPKGQLLLVLAPMAILGAVAANLPHAAANIASALLAAALVDVCLALWTRDEWIFPSGALLTGLIVAMVLSPVEAPAVAAFTSAIAIGTKYIFRTRWSNIFNPAALALVVSYQVFGSEQSWWGALPDLPVQTVIVLVVAGAYIADRTNKLPMVLVFLGAFFGLFTVTALLSDPARVFEVFRPPDVNSALFFAFFMLDDPPTSPVRYPDQVAFGLLAAVASYAVFVTVGAVYYLPAGVLFANAWESSRRVIEHNKRRA